MPTTVIDPSDEELFNLAKLEADANFDGDNHEILIIRLIQKKKLLRFTHDFEGEKLYIDFPDKK